MLLERQRQLDRIFRTVGDLPALPITVAEVLTLTEDPSANMEQVSEIIQHDPALTAKVLRVSNAPYYGMRQYVGTLRLALVLLGVREVRNIVLGVSVFDMLHGGKLDAMLLREFWDHSVQVGGITKKLATELYPGLQGEDFVSGLLHDMGKILFLRQFRPKYEEVFQASGGCGNRLCAMETETFGFDHADGAAALASHWNLPQTLKDALWCHHASPDRPLAGAKDPKLAALVRLADALAREDRADPGNPCCTDEDAWEILDRCGEYSDPAARRQLLDGLLADLDLSEEPH